LASERPQIALPACRFRHGVGSRHFCQTFAPGHGSGLLSLKSSFWCFAADRSNDVLLSLPLRVGSDRCGQIGRWTDLRVGLFRAFRVRHFRRPRGRPPGRLALPPRPLFCPLFDGGLPSLGRRALSWPASASAGDQTGGLGGGCCLASGGEISPISASAMQRVRRLAALVRSNDYRALALFRLARERPARFCRRSGATAFRSDDHRETTLRADL
jgi:hypothetical protein